MHHRYLLAAILAVALPMHAAFGQAVQYATVGTDPKPVAQPPAPSEDSPEDIARDSARDLNGSRFYNKPGATRAEYDAAWQECRLIARGSRTPSGMIPYYYNPAVVSPLAAGIGGGLGGALAGAIIEGEQRRANRRTCLLVRGWRMVDLPAAEAARLATLGAADRDAYFNARIGAPTVEGEVTERLRFTPVEEPSFQLDAPLAGPSVVYLGRKVVPATPVVLAPGEAALVFAYRRPGLASAGRAAALQFARYDPAGRDLVYQPKDWKKKGDLTTYLVTAPSGDRQAVHEVQVLRVTAGDYVLASSIAGTKVPSGGSYCFGAPSFHVNAGQVAYLGDFVPIWGAKDAAGKKYFGMSYIGRVEDARQALAAAQPALARDLKPADIRNAATYACAGTLMDRFDLPGFASVAPPPPPAS